MKFGIGKVSTLIVDASVKWLVAGTSLDARKILRIAVGIESK